MKRNSTWIALGIIWTVVFAGMSFYWAMGGKMGARSLGGAIYEMSLNPSSSFITILWVTGFIKLFGVLWLLMLTVQWNNSVMKKMLYYVTKVVGALLFLYGLLNSMTVSLSALNVLDFDLDRYAIFWRLVFWEPYWMIGGILYYFSVKKECG